MRKKTLRNEGFTLIELLIAIVIITALAVTVFVTINPTKKLIDSRDARRKQDIETILTAIHEYIVDNGNLPPSLQARGQGFDWQLGNGTCTTQISTGGCFTQPGCVDFTTDLSKYLAKIPIDPLGAANGNTAAATGYAVSYSPPTNTITIKACKTGNLTTEGTINILQSR